MYIEFSLVCNLYQLIHEIVYLVLLYDAAFTEKKVLMLQLGLFLNFLYDIRGKSEFSKKLIWSELFLVSFF